MWRADRWLGMRRHLPVLLAGLLSSCTRSAHTHQTPPPFAYARELGELVDAVEDLRNGSVIAGDSQPTGDLIEKAFLRFCKQQEVSCDRQSWQHPWVNPGGSGKALAHALGDLDRVSMVLSRTFENPNFALLNQELGEARRDVRALLVQRERMGQHMPADRVVVDALEDLEYARLLVGEEMPPADMPWDHAGTADLLDHVIAALEAANVDVDAPSTVFLPAREDFTVLKYPSRLLVAADIVGRVTDELERDRKLPLARPERDKMHEALKSAYSNLAYLIVYAAPERRIIEPHRRTPAAATPHDRELALIVDAWLTAHSTDVNVSNAQHAAALREINDAFLAACKAEHLEPVKTRWNAYSHAEGGWGAARWGIDIAIAMFEQMPDQHFAEAMGHLETAHRMLTEMLLTVAHQDKVEGKAYLALRDSLGTAWALLDVVPPADMPWEPAPTLADLEAARAAIAKAFAIHNPRPPGDVAGMWRYSYRVRVQIARDLLARDVAAVERSGDKGPRAAVAPYVQRVLATLERVLGPARHGMVTAAAGRR